MSCLDGINAENITVAHFFLHQRVWVNLGLCPSSTGPENNREGILCLESSKKFL